MAGAELKDLANAAGDWILVALGASLCVIDGPEAVGYLLALLEGSAVGVEGRLWGESVGQVVEAGGRFRWYWIDC